MQNIGVFFGSSTGNTEDVANKIASKLNAETYDIANNPMDAIAKCDNLILGSSTLGIGDLQDDWEDFLPELASADLSGKVVAIFGLGDGASYSDSFVDAMGTIYNELKDKGCIIVGSVDTDGYDFDDSTSIIDDKFVGLAIDEDNESDKTDERIEKWIESIKSELK